MAGPQPAGFEGPSLVRSDGLVALARRICREQRAALDRLGVAGELRLVGGASMPGLLTYGDVDLLLRVPASAFREVTARLRAVHPVRLEEAWSDELALFLVDTNAPVELAVTPLGSLQDRHFVVAWQRLSSSNELRERYNRLKSGPPDADYAARKGLFFHELVQDPVQPPDGASPR